MGLHSQDAARGARRGILDGAADPRRRPGRAVRERRARTAVRRATRRRRRALVGDGSPRRSSDRVRAPGVSAPGGCTLDRGGERRAGAHQRLEVTGWPKSTDSGMIGGVLQSASPEEYAKLLDLLERGLRSARP